MYHKEIIEKSRGVTATCFNCNNAVSFTYDIEMNVYSDNDDLSKREYCYKIPYLKLRCPSCKQEMTISSNAIGRLNKAINDFIVSQDMFVLNTSSNWSFHVVQAKDNGIRLVDNNILHDYDYPSITYTFKDHIDRWKYAYIFMITTDFNEFLYDSKCLISINLDQENNMLTLSLDVANINYCYIDNKKEIAFTDYITNTFIKLLDRCAETVEKVKDVKSEDVISIYSELVGKPRREFKYIPIEGNKSV